MKKLFITLVTTFLTISTVNAKTLVAYFSFPINNGKESLDASSGASVVPDTNGEGNAEFIAKTVARTLGSDADLFEIDTGNHYPRDYGKLFEVVPAEQRKDIRPALLQRVKDISEYDKIAIITPIWYYRMPLAVQSFLDEYDLSGKTIYLCVTHGGSGIGGIDREIAKAEPNATVSRNTLSLSRRETAKSERRIIEWAKSFQ